MCVKSTKKYIIKLKNRKYILLTQLKMVVKGKLKIIKQRFVFGYNGEIMETDEKNKGFIY